MDRVMIRSDHNYSAEFGKTNLSHRRIEIYMNCSDLFFLGLVSHERKLLPGWVLHSPNSANPTEITYNQQIHIDTCTPHILADILNHEISLIVLCRLGLDLYT